MKLEDIEKVVELKKERDTLLKAKSLVETKGVLSVFSCECNDHPIPIGKSLKDAFNEITIDYIDSKITDINDKFITLGVDV